MVTLPTPSIMPAILTAGLGVKLVGKLAAQNWASKLQTPYIYRRGYGGTWVPYKI